MPTTVMTLKEVAEYLKCSSSSIYRMLTDKNCDLPHWRIGSDYRFSRERIDAWIEGRQK